MPTTVLPYIFILDWDGTIAGRVDFQSQQYSLHMTLRKHGFRTVRQHAIPPAFYPNAKLIRPGIASFVKNMQRFYHDVHIFIYTASEKQWAHQEIAWMEKTHGIQFARPIFTRDDCTIDGTGSVRKSVAKIFPKIVKAINKNRSAPFTPQERTAILDKQTMIIDNNAVYTDRIDKLLLCPDYHYAVFENLLHGIPVQARNHPAVQQYIYSLANMGLLCPLPNDQDDGMKLLTRQYEWLATKCRSITEVNAAYEKDDFWIYLKKLIIQNQLRTFSPSVIKQLQDAVWKHMQKTQSKKRT